MTPSPAYEAWIERAREKDILEMAGTLGARLKKAGAAELVGACPVCGGVDRFSVNTKRRVFNCRGSGQGGDVIEMTRHVRGCDFIAACEEITGEPPPRGDSHRRDRDPDIDRERREERRDAVTERYREEESKMIDHIKRATALFERGRAIEGTVAQDYIEEWRCLDISAFSTKDLRFINKLDYWGEPSSDAKDENGDPYSKDAYVKLGEFPCLIAAMRNISGQITGIKRIYLDVSGKKLKPPGSRNNAAKKGTYSMRGGLVYLDEIGELLAIAEGVETAIAWKMMSRIGEFGDEFAHATIVSGDSLGNMTSDDLQLPKDVKSVVIIGDSDSDPKRTMSALLKAGQRFKELGLCVHVHMAPSGLDWADVVLSNRGRRDDR